MTVQHEPPNQDAASAAAVSGCCAPAEQVNCCDASAKGDGHGPTRVVT